MNRIKRWIPLLAFLVPVLIGGAVLLSSGPRFQSVPAVKEASARKDEIGKVREIHLFTVEFKTKMNGKEREVYRFDPGAVTIRKGERIRLLIHGFHGREHHFSIPGLNLRGIVEKGKTASLEFSADRPGNYRLICHNHATLQTEGPMVAELTVVDR